MNPPADLLAALAAVRRAIELIEARIRAEGSSDARDEPWPPADLSAEPYRWLTVDQAAGLRRAHKDTLYSILRNPRGRPIGFKLEAGGRWWVDRTRLLSARRD